MQIWGQKGAPLIQMKGVSARNRRLSKVLTITFLQPFIERELYNDVCNSEETGNETPVESSPAVCAVYYSEGIQGMTESGFSRSLRLGVRQTL